MKKVITFHYTLADKDGKVIDSSQGQNPLIFLEGSGQIIPGLETVVIQMNKGEKKDIKVPYKDAYGPYDQTLVYQIPREKFPNPNIKVGDMFQVGSEDQYRVMTVLEINDKEISLDGNHPLAGQDLNFSIEITDKRDATPEEVSHGHIHGPDGHHHH